MYPAQLKANSLYASSFDGKCRLCWDEECALWYKELTCSQCSRGPLSKDQVFPAQWKVQDMEAAGFEGKCRDCYDRMWGGVGSSANLYCSRCEEGPLTSKQVFPSQWKNKNMNAIHNGMCRICQGKYHCTCGHCVY